MNDTTKLMETMTLIADELKKIKPDDAKLAMLNKKLDKLMGVDSQEGEDPELAGIWEHSRSR